MTTTVEFCIDDPMSIVAVTVKCPRCHSGLVAGLGLPIDKPPEGDVRLRCQKCDVDYVTEDTLSGYVVTW